ncbi:MAG: lytic transglycosylase domain-containing protein [Candidatus Methanosuratincola sp.]
MRVLLGSNRILSLFGALAFLFPFAVDAVAGSFYFKRVGGVPTYTNIPPPAGGFKRVTYGDGGGGRGGFSLGGYTYSEHYDALIKKTASWFEIDPNLVKAIIKVESNFNRGAISSKGAMGVMQLMPETARDHGVSDPFDPEDNIIGGTRYLAKLMNMFGGDLELVLAAYNAGENAVVRNGYKIPPYAETQEYVRKVLHHYNYLKTSSKHRL